MVGQKRTWSNLAYQVALKKFQSSNFMGLKVQRQGGMVLVIARNEK